MQPQIKIPNKVLNDMVNNEPNYNNTLQININHLIQNFSQDKLKEQIMSLQNGNISPFKRLPSPPKNTDSNYQTLLKGGESTANFERSPLLMNDQHGPKQMLPYDSLKMLKTQFLPTVSHDQQQQHQQQHQPLPQLISVPNQQVTLHIPIPQPHS